MVESKGRIGRLEQGRRMHFFPQGYLHKTHWQYFLVKRTDMISETMYEETASRWPPTILFYWNSWFYVISFHQDLSMWPKWRWQQPFKDLGHCDFCVFGPLALREAVLSRHLSSLGTWVLESHWVLANSQPSEGSMWLSESWPSLTVNFSDMHPQWWNLPAGTDQHASQESLANRNSHDSSFPLPDFSPMPGLNREGGKKKRSFKSCIRLTC